MIPKTLSDFHGPWEPAGDQRNYKVCPLCGSTAWKVYVSPEKGKWVCFGGRHPLNPHGGPGGGNLRLEANADAPGQHIIQMLDSDPPTEWGEIELPEWEPLSQSARFFLRRKYFVTSDEARDLGIVEWTDKYRVLVPYFDDSGQLIYWASRRYSAHQGEGPKYLTAPGRHPLYTLKTWAKGFMNKSTPVIVEGAFDAISVWRAGYSAIALGGKTIPKYLQKSLLTLVANCGIINVLLDHDAMPQALRIHELLTSKPGVQEVRVRFCPSDKDPGDLTPEQIREVLQ